MLQEASLERNLSTRPVTSVHVSKSKVTRHTSKDQDVVVLQIFLRRKLIPTAPQRS